MSEPGLVLLIDRSQEVDPGRPLRAFFGALDVAIDSVFNTLTAELIIGGTK
jgi:hypothetical protein